MRLGRGDITRRGRAARARGGSRRRLRRRARRHRRRRSSSAARRSRSGRNSCSRSRARWRSIRAVLILDEATSSVDTETELLIRDALRVLMQGSDHARDRASSLDDSGHGSHSGVSQRRAARIGHAPGAARGARDLPEAVRPASTRLASARAQLQRARGKCAARADSLPRASASAPLAALASASAPLACARAASAPRRVRSRLQVRARWRSRCRNDGGRNHDAVVSLSKS